MKKIIIILSALCSISTYGREKAAGQRQAPGSNFSQKIMAECAAPKAAQELWVNNVRTIIYSGGDMWWDLQGNGNAYYIVPATSNRNNGVSSSFAGSIWLGGLDAGGQLKVAAMTYRQNGIDFWPGPLDKLSAAADPAECLKYDQIFNINRAEVDNFVAGGVLTANILGWPGNGDPTKNQDQYLAPFVDVTPDGFYDPASGDYPAYDVLNLALKDNLGFCKTKLYGDQTLFWVFNDKGGAHTETQGVPIGVEVRAQAFAFKTNDEINNMTFYSYEIHNRSSFQLNQTYFTIWNDADLGYYLDDYVGCDVSRGLGYIYNADPFDETAAGTNGYGDFPPALGCDFFKGPLADVDNVDNDKDNLVDEPGETIQMSRFTYYNNNIGAFPPQTTNPDIAIHYYNFMTGFWKDGSPFTFGGNAYGGTAPATYVYDGNPVAGTGWTEKSAGNLPGDRRFLQSAGPFTLKPGQVNDITFGMPWAQSPVKGGNLTSIDLLKSADDKAQALFDNCFKLLDGPEAPNMTIQEINNELIIYLTNEKGKSNNYKQFNNDYAETDISILSDPTSNIPAIQNPDKVYRFEGYIVYQIANDQVTSTDLSDRTKAIPVFQCDITNGVSRLVNYELDNNVGAVVPKVKVEGSDKGVVSTFKVTDDAFSTSSNRKLINNKTYYFLAVAYAYNNYLTYTPDVPVTSNPSSNLLGQKRPYLEGRKLKRAAGIPHIPEVEKDGTVAQSAYGFGPKITRIEGQGNGGNILTMTKASEDEIVNNGFKADINYENAQGPINIKVVDPLNVKNSDFTFRFINSRVAASSPQTNVLPMPNSTGSNTTGIAALNVDSTSWELKDLQSGKLYYPNAITNPTLDLRYETIKVGNEFYFPDLGFSLTIKQVGDPGETSGKFTNFALETSDYAGPAPGAFIGASISYVNGTSGWLNPIKDVDGATPTNWILSGNNKTAGSEDAFYKKDNDGVITAFYDPKKQFGNILGGTWAPYPLAASYYSITASSAANVPSRVFGGPGLNGKVWESNKVSFPAIFGLSGNTSPSQDGNTDLRKISSVIIVYTKDKSKWTRCPVIEMQEKYQLSENGGIFFGPRQHFSVNKDGAVSTTSASSNNPDDPNYISGTGMGWFPGYAINIETGERLNMMFGEDSYQKENNGNDMIWNPTSSVNSPYPYAFGGKHFVYVFGGNSIQSTYPTPGNFGWEATLGGKPYGQLKYDAGARNIFVLKEYFGASFGNDNSGAGLGPLNGLERDIMWVSMPMPAFGFGFTKPENMPSDVRMQINVAKPYRYGFSGVATYATPQTAISINKLQNVNSPSMLTTDINTVDPQNNNFPMYKFNTSDIAALFADNATAKNALDLIRIVPNPYYGSSAYETKRIDNRVRITNLPSKCTIKIFTMNGTLVRTITRDVTGQEDIYLGTTGSGTDIKQAKRSPYVDWDLKNQSNISIASGLYIFHIDAPGVGEKILKWFGVMRPLDVQSY
ncbi:MAG: hypothetical protein H0W73_03020 [Bacteroidetes bacterium]|nr:hypothetical protein [Bacteroidota bacterium]